jgi:hypothetical protein
MPPTLLINPLKIGVFQQARRLGKCRIGLLLGTATHDGFNARRGNYSRKPGFTETRLRPLARRRDSTACPLLVFIRERKPCFFTRLRRLGWNVRFGMETHELLTGKMALRQTLSIKDASIFRQFCLRSSPRSHGDTESCHSERARAQQERVEESLCWQDGRGSRNPSTSPRPAGAPLGMTARVLRVSLAKNTNCTTFEALTLSALDNFFAEAFLDETFLMRDENVFHTGKSFVLGC